MASPDRPAGSYSELARLSAVETLKALSKPEEITIDELVRFLDSNGMWEQFAQITLDDLKHAFTPEVTKRKKRRLLADEFGDEETPKRERAPAAPADGGLDTEEVARQILPFVEGNGEVGLEDMADYTRLDRKVLRYHVGILVKDGRLERLGTGRGALYSTIG